MDAFENTFDLPNDDEGGFDETFAHGRNTGIDGEEEDEEETDDAVESDSTDEEE